MRWIAGLLLGLVALVGHPVLAATYYVAPLNTVIVGTPDGSEVKPFASIPDAFKSGKVKGGDTLLLKDGAYGDVIIKANASFDSPVTITSQNGRGAQFDSILLQQNTRNLVFLRLSIWPRDLTKGKPYLFHAYSTTSDITVQYSTVCSDRWPVDFMSWDAATWNARKYSGIFLQGPRSAALVNVLMGVYHGVMTEGADSKIINNTIDGFNGDGLRALGDNTLVRANRVFNSVATDTNHDDGFQSYAGASGRVKGLVIDSNVIVEWTRASNPLRGQLQGIGMFDGFYDDLTIKNNIIATTAYHGISVYGARNATIVNNTVVNGNGQTSKYPWLNVSKHKNGTPSSDVLVANNLAMTFLNPADPVNRVEYRDNSIIGTPGAVFVDPFAFNYQPKDNSGFIDTADASIAPKYDVMNQKRPSGKNPDRGAYETQGSSAKSAGMQSLMDVGGAPAADKPVVAGVSPSVTDKTGAKWVGVPLRTQGSGN